MRLLPGLRPIARCAGILLLGILSGTLSASASALRLLAPAPGAELTAGELAVLEWDSPSGLGRAEEWEAFLSLDGGETYPLRLTPHLDPAIRRYSFRVPDLPTRRARLLLRYGDERWEETVESPALFSITGRLGWRNLLPLDRIHRLSHGESARTGEPGVVLWIEGSRDGRGVREVAGAETGSSLAAVTPLRAFSLALLWPPAARAELPPPAVGAAPVQHSERFTEPGPAPPAGIEVRLLIHRFNE